jgi:hypothetical protein
MKKPFFGGGSKLAVENIPADADKIEVIDHLNEVGFMKQVSTVMIYIHECKTQSR